MMMRKICSAVAACLLAVAGYGASRQATENWVKQYIASYTAAGSSSFIVAEDAESLAANPLSVTFTDPDDTNIVFTMTYTTATNLALVVSDSNVAGITNGTMWAWSENDQRFFNKDFALMEKLTKETRRVTIEGANGNTYVDDRVFYTGTDTNGVNWLTYFSDGVWLKAGNDLSKHFRLNTVTITDSARNALLGSPTPPVVWFNPFTGERVEMRSRAVSSETGGKADNAGGSLSITVKYKGQTKTISVGSPPDATLPCDVADGNGNYCIKQRYDYSLWNDPKNWGITFPISITFDDGTTKNYSEGLFKQMSGWNDFVDSAIDQSRKAHLPHEFDEPHTHEHECERGKDCVCTWKCDQKEKGKPCDFECKKQLSHLGTREERKLPTVIDVGDAFAWCEYECLNANCYKYRIDHSLMYPVIYQGTDPVTGETKDMSNTHSCCCGGKSAGHYRYKESETTATDGTKTVSYKCYLLGGDDCGWTWDEINPAEEHQHHYAPNEDDDEVCYITIYTYNKDGSIATQEECGDIRPHSFTTIGEGGKCYECQNHFEDGSKCAKKKHGGHWRFGGSEEDPYHYCDCGDEMASCGSENYKETEYEVTEGENTKKIRVDTWNCPSPTAGCGHQFVVTNDLGFIEKEQHGCTLYGDRKDECDASLDRNKSDCTCILHPKHQFEHQIGEHTAGKYTCARCKHCGATLKGEAGATFHSQKMTSLDSPDTAKAIQKGHKCACGKYTEAHTFDDGKASRKAQDGKLVNSVKYTCTKCSFYYEDTSEEACGHGYYELDNEGSATGDFVSLWNNCVCDNCAATREHKWNASSPIAVAGSCPKYPCMNENGAQWGGTCNATTNLASGAHIGWIDLDPPSPADATATTAPKPSEMAGHKCFCGLSTKGHDYKSFAGEEYACEIEVRCSAPTNGCSHLHFAYHSGDYTTCGLSGNVFCKTCKRKLVRDANGKDSWVAADSVDHSFGGKSDAERVVCVCDCTMMTNHYFAVERTTCACQCGGSLSHIRGTDPSCYCTGAPNDPHGSAKVLIGHQQPYSTSRTSTTNQCVQCGKNWEKWTDKMTCGVCGEVVKTVNGGGSHECTGGEVTAGTYTLTWGKWTEPDGNGGTIEHEGGSESGSWGGGGMSALGAWNTSGGISASGATIKVTQSGWYSLQAKIDDGGSVSIGGLTASGGSSWREFGEKVYGYLDAGIVSVSASASSGEAIVGFEYNFEYFGQEHPTPDAE